MLISSPRQRPEDLRLWAELEQADRAAFDSKAMNRQADRSIDAIRSFADHGLCYAGTSWGKDSVVLCHLLILSRMSIPLIHLRPTNHNPDCDAVRDAFLSRLPGLDYQEVVVDYSRVDRSLPDWLLDKATDREWYAAIRRSGEPFNHRHILGIRSDESFGRRVRGLKWGLNSPNGSAPLSWWTEREIFAWLAHHDLPTHPAYAMLGGGRWPRDRLRVAEIGDTHGKGSGRNDWEREYYGDILRRIESSMLP